jgi:hypothetical protein
VRKTHFLLLMMSLILISCSSADTKQGILSLISYSKKAGVGYRVYVEDGYAYITNNKGVVIFDVRQPERPRKVGKIHAGVTFGIYVDNGLVYASGRSGLVIVDVNDLKNPVKLGEYIGKEETLCIHVDSKYAYISSNRGLEILDISDPGTVNRVAHYGDKWSEGVTVAEGIAYLACFSTGIQVIDVTVPASPQKITTVAGTEGAWDVHVHGDFLYAGCHGRGIKILNISDRKSPRIIGSYCDDDRGEALGVWGDGTRLYVADNYNIEVLDVSDPANPHEVGEYKKVAGAHDIFVDGDYIYVAEAKKGLIIFELKQDQRH